MMCDGKAAVPVLPGWLSFSMWKCGCIGTAFHIQHRSIKEPTRHSIPHPTPKHTDTSQYSPSSTTRNSLKKRPRGVQRGAALCTFAVILFCTKKQLLHHKDVRAKSNGWRRIRTFEGGANRFTVCPLWPLGNPSVTNEVHYT